MLARREWFRRTDRAIARWMAAHGVRLLRWALAVVFIWFGVLKLWGVSPVVDLVARTVYWFSPDWFVLFLGGWEVAVGLGLLFGIALRATLLLLFLLLGGTFLVLVMQPELAFQDGNLLRLTLLGEFVIKNLVLIAAALVIGGTVAGEEGEAADANW